MICTIGVDIRSALLSCLVLGEARIVRLLGEAACSSCLDGNNMRENNDTCMLIGIVKLLTWANAIAELVLPVQS